MSKVVLPPLPSIREWPHSREELRARDLDVARVMLEAAAQSCFDQQRGWASDDHIACADAIRALEVSHD